MNPKLVMTYAALNITLSMFACQSSLTKEEAIQNNEPIQMKSRDAIDQELRNHDLLHLADNSNIARRLGSSTVTATTLDQIIKEEHDAYLNRFPGERSFLIVWLSRVVRGVASHFP